MDHLNRESSVESSPADLKDGLAHVQLAFSVTRPTTLRALSVTRPATCLGPAGAHYTCLLDMLREEEGEEEEEEEKISQEEIQLFHSRQPHLSSEREKLR